MTGSIYSGDQRYAEPVVRVMHNGVSRELPNRADLLDRDPVPFSWGNKSQGAAQLAVSILAHAMGDTRAVTLHKAFLASVSTWHTSRPFVISSETIEAEVNKADGSTS